MTVRANSIHTVRDTHHKDMSPAIQDPDEEKIKEPVIDWSKVDYSTIWFWHVRHYGQIRDSIKGPIPPLPARAWYWDENGRLLFEFAISEEFVKKHVDCDWSHVPYSRETK